MGGHREMRGTLPGNPDAGVQRERRPRASEGGARAGTHRIAGTAGVRRLEVRGPVRTAQAEGHPGGDRGRGRHRHGGGSGNGHRGRLGGGAGAVRKLLQPLPAGSHRGSPPNGGGEAPEGEGAAPRACPLPPPRGGWVVGPDGGAHRGRDPHHRGGSRPDVRKAHGEGESKRGSEVHRAGCGGPDRVRRPPGGVHAGRPGPACHAGTVSRDRTQWKTSKEAPPRRSFPGRWRDWTAPRAWPWRWPSTRSRNGGRWRENSSSWSGRGRRRRRWPPSRTTCSFRREPRSGWRSSSAGKVGGRGPVRWPERPPGWFVRLRFLSGLRRRGWRGAPPLP